MLDRPQTATIYAEQTNPAFRPLGACGGSDGREARVSVFAPDGRRMRLPSKVTLTLQPGTVIRVETSGGGGFGDPRERDPEMSRADALDARTVR